MGILLSEGVGILLTWHVAVPGSLTLDEVGILLPKGIGILLTWRVGVPGVAVAPVDVGPSLGVISEDTRIVTRLPFLAGVFVCEGTRSGLFK